MYDEHIKSRLIKDIRFFRETKDQSDQKVGKGSVCVQMNVLWKDFLTTGQGKVEITQTTSRFTVGAG